MRNNMELTVGSLAVGLYEGASSGLKIGGIEAAVFAANSFVFKLGAPKTAAVYALSRSVIGYGVWHGITFCSMIHGAKLSSREDPNRAWMGAVVGSLAGGVVAIPPTLVCSIWGGMKISSKMPTPMRLRTVALLEGIHFAECLAVRMSFE
jgi:hypothetical protein